MPTVDPVPTAARVPRTPFTRARVLWALLLLGAVALGCASATWISTEVATALRPAVAVTATGNEAAAVVSASALVLLACGPTLGITGRIGRYVVLVVAALAGAGMIAGVFTVVGDREVAGRAAAADAVGVTDLTAPVDLTVWPAVTAVAGALAVAVAIAAVFTAHHWPEASRRHERDSATGSHPARHGDSVSGSHRAGHGDEATTDSTLVRDDGGGGDRPEGPTDPAGDWDALTRGEDPTREDR